MSRGAWVWALWSLGISAMACHGQENLAGADEPVRVRGGTFVEGALPGAPPPAEGAEPAAPRVTVVESPANLVRQGQAQKQLLGRATDDAVALGVALEGAGTGHWVVPLGSPDPAAPGELVWSLSLDVGYEVSPGRHRLLLAALDAEGQAGSQFGLELCVTGEVPDGAAACDAALVPPAAVFSLGWDHDADLDLVVVTPEGKFVDPKHPSTALDPEGEPRAGDGAFDRDGMAGCNSAGARRENLVFEQKPRPGNYYVFVRLFDACGEPAAPFVFSLHLAEGDPAASREVLTVPGQVLPIHAEGGEDLGLFVAEVTIQ